MDQPEIKKRVPDPKNPKVKINGTVIKIKDSEEPFSYAHLEDGTRVTTKMSFIEVIRLDDRWDDDGQPVYNVTQNIAMIVTSPETLMKKGGKNGG